MQPELTVEELRVLDEMVANFNYSVGHEQGNGASVGDLQNNGGAVGDVQDNRMTDPQRSPAIFRAARSDSEWAELYCRRLDPNLDKKQSEQIRGRLRYLKSKPAKIGREQLQFFAENPDLAERYLPPGSPNHATLQTYLKTRGTAPVETAQQAAMQQTNRSSGRRGRLDASEWAARLEAWGNGSLDPEYYTKTARHLKNVSGGHTKLSEEELEVMRRYKNLQCHLPVGAAQSDSASVQQAARQTAPVTWPAGPSTTDSRNVETANLHTETTAPQKSRKRHKSDQEWVDTYCELTNGEADQRQRKRIIDRLRDIKVRGTHLGPRQLEFFAENKELADRYLPPGSPNHEQLQRHLAQKIVQTHPGPGNFIPAGWAPGGWAPGGSAGVQQTAWQTTPGAWPAGPSSYSPPAGGFQYPGTPSTSHGQGRH
ncbi:hypothetical protein ABT336_08485 [Micromonospora sp. NPDC000207]|uniref:hypothetical protein n=1 Tax=Micromonospora sp. NPDC000207 TaxID=3154246 RepID=UPI00332DF8D4